MTHGSGIDDLFTFHFFTPGKPPPPGLDRITRLAAEQITALGQRYLADTQIDKVYCGEGERHAQVAQALGLIVRSSDKRVYEPYRCTVHHSSIFGSSAVEDDDDMVLTSNNRVPKSRWTTAEDMKPAVEAKLRDRRMQDYGVVICGDQAIVDILGAGQKPHTNVAYYQITVDGKGTINCRLVGMAPM